MIRRFFLLSLIALGASSSVARASDESPVRAKLVMGRTGSSGGRLAPGKGAWVGVLFTMDPDWHIYWKYPGEIGLPTKVEISLPEGFKTEPLEWPAPVAFRAGDQPVGFGYGTETLVWARTEVPEGYRPGTSVPVTVKTKWLGCGKKACIPGKAELSGDLGKAGDQNASLLKLREGEVPPTTPATDLDAKLEAANGEAGKIAYTLRLAWRGAPPPSIEWYPLPPEGVKLTGIEVLNPQEARFDVKRTGGAPPKGRFDSYVRIVGEKGAGALRYLPLSFGE